MGPPQRQLDYDAEPAPGAGDACAPGTGDTCLSVRHRRHQRVYELEFLHNHAPHHTHNRVLCAEEHTNLPDLRHELGGLRMSELQDRVPTLTWTATDDGVAVRFTCPPQDGTLDAVLRATMDAGLAIRSCSTERQDLREVFDRLVEEQEDDALELDLSGSELPPMESPVAEKPEEIVLDPSFDAELPELSSEAEIPLSEAPAEEEVEPVVDGVFRAYPTIDRGEPSPSTFGGREVDFSPGGMVKGVGVGVGGNGWPASIHITRGGDRCRR